jgi:phosphatidylinositol alpha-1,6-mannosyltransferase
MSMTACQVLLLTPSRGQGGGIERYVQTVEWAFGTAGVSYQRLDLAGPGLPNHRRLLAEAAHCLAAWTVPVRLVLAHRALLPVAALLARGPAVCGTSVICHGSDVWGARLRPRWYAERMLLRRHRVRVVAVSSYTAGALSARCRATILPPGLSRGWFDELAAAGRRHRGRAQPAGPGLRIVTAFRLADWRDKGLPELITALAALGRQDVQLAICGSGPLPPDLMRLIRAHPWCTVRAGLADRELAGQLAAADLFVLATRTRPGRRACGEGFGLVLLEAQLAGTPVVAPAHGGAPDAYLDGITGTAPIDESPAALASVLGPLLKDPARLGQMGCRAAAWAAERFDPDQYAAIAVARLL